MSSDVFAVIRLDLCSLGRKIMECLSHQIIQGLILLVLLMASDHLDPLSEVVFINCRVALFLFSLSKPDALEESHYVQPTCRSGELCFPSLKVGIYINCLKFFCIGMVSSLYLIICGFVYSIIYLFSMNLWVFTFILWVIIQ